MKWKFCSSARCSCPGLLFGKLVICGRDSGKAVATVSVSMSVHLKKLKTADQKFSENVYCHYCGESWKWLLHRMSALLSLQSAVLARWIQFVRPSICPSVTFRCCVQMNEDTIMWLSVPLVSGEVKFIQIFARDHPQRGH